LCGQTSSETNRIDGFAFRDVIEHSEKTAPDIQPALQS
jgi:hypothetical protein